MKKALTAALVLTLTGPMILFSPPQAVASHQFLSFSSSGDATGTFGANEGVLVDGAIEYLRGCSEGIDDFFYPIADVYVVEAGLASGTLSDVTGAPNTVFGVGGGAFVSELIAYTAPGGSLGNGFYDVVFDECQDGVLGPEDALFPKAITVKVPVDVPPLPSDAIARLKREAADMARHWESAHANYTVLFELHDRVTGGKKDIADKLKDFAETFADVWGQGIDIKEGALATIAAAGLHHKAIAADPPAPDADQITGLQPRPRVDVADDDPLVVAGAALGAAAADEGAIALPLLHALERYQGAQLSGDGDAALLQARAITAHADLLAVSASASSAAVSEVRAALAADTRDLDATADDIVAFREEVLASGFTPDMQRVLTNLGFDAATRERLLRAIVTGPSAAFAEHAFDDLLEQHEAAAAALSGTMARLASEMRDVVTALEATDGVTDVRPVVDAGGPYVGREGDALVLDGSASTAATTINDWAWDVDGDGAFDDASGARPTVSLSTAMTRFIGLQVTDAAGRTNVGYAVMDVTASNARPELRTLSPDGNRATATVGEGLAFAVTSADADDDPLVVRWLLDGALVGEGSGFTYTPTGLDIGIHGIEVQVLDGQAPGGAVRHRWLVDVLDEDADADGWHANVDCDDAAPNRHPGNGEIAGNGVDDDCDSSTTDAGLAGSAVLPPVLAMIQQTQVFYAYSTPDEALDVSFTKHSTRSDGGHLTVTVSHAGVADRTCTHSPGQALGATCGWSGLTAPIAGIWTIEFRADDEGLNTHNYAWQIAIRNGDDTVPGRVWSERYLLRQNDRDLISFSIWHVTEDGYRYQANYRDFHGINSILQSDAVGVRFNGTCVSAHRSASAEVDGVSAANGQCGDRHKLFFAHPADDLPATATLPDGSSTWLAPVVAAPRIRNARFTPYDSPILSGTIGFDVPGFTGGATVLIDANGDGDDDDDVDVALPVFVDSGSATVAFDGLDGAGQAIEAGRVLDASIDIERVGEVHFQNGDVEGRQGGLEVLALNGPTPGVTELFWDDTRLSRASRCSATPVVDGTVGVDSGGGVHGWSFCTSTTPGSWGNNRVIDDWTFNAAASQAVLQLAAPHADAGGPYVTDEGGGVRLDAAESAGGAVAIVAYDWDLDGDGEYDDAAGISVPMVLPDDTALTVGLRITARDGRTATDTATVRATNLAPVVDAGPDDTVTAQAVLAPAWFEDAGTADTHLTTIDWGDGTVESGTLHQAAGSGTVAGSHTYRADGTYNVEVCVADDDGDAGCDSLQLTAVVGNQAPEVELEAPHEVESSEQPHIHALAVSDPNPGDTHTGTVDWGDGTAEPLVIKQGRGVAASFPAHTWPGPGDYLVSVSVCDDRGLCDTATITESVVGNIPPVADAGGPYDVDEGGVVRLDGTTSDDADGDELTYTWSLDGATYHGAVVEIPLGDDFLGEATLTVDDHHGGTAVDTAVVTVHNVAPTVDVGGGRTTAWGLAVSLSATVLDPGQADAAAGFVSTWDVGDGSEPQHGQEVIHVYRDPGSYTATATARDKDGGVGTDRALVTVTRRATRLTSVSPTVATFGFTALSAQLIDQVDAGTAALGGMQVDFAVAGRTYTATTDRHGMAHVSEPVLVAPGTHDVDVTFAGSSHYRPSTATASLDVGNSDGHVTAGALRTPSQGSAGFVVRSRAKGVEGELQYDDASGRYHAKELTALGIADDGTSAWFAGTGTDGRTFLAYVEDHGEPGRDDLFRLWIDRTPLTGDGRLRGGNITIHA